MTMTLPCQQPERFYLEPDEDRWQLTVAGGVALGYGLDPTGRGPVLAYSPDLELYVRMR